MKYHGCLCPRCFWKNKLVKLYSRGTHDGIRVFETERTRCKGGKRRKEIIKVMAICDRCGKEYGFVKHIVRNYYPDYGFPHDTEKSVCEKCQVRFKKYITKQYNNFFEGHAK